MECYSFENVNFSYPETEEKALRNVNFSIEHGAFLVLCGPSGCGKSTLLRRMKCCLAPHGSFSGEIKYFGERLSDVDERRQAAEIGFVMQSPENQVVTDKVWHELAFGLESLGMDTPTIRRRVAETAAFFGIENWFYKNVEELSGGQKQLLSLASVMVMQPKVLILDEPTAQLDPIAAEEFLAQLAKINRELGTSIVISEHRLEEVFPYASQVIVMERGTVVCDDKPDKVGIHLRDKGSAMFLAMPTAMRVWAGIDTELDCPLTVRDGSRFLEERDREQAILTLQEKPLVPYGETVLTCDELWFRYEKDSPDILKGFSLELGKGCFYALLGGNGTGKSTALKVIFGLKAAYRGQLEIKGRIAMLPQNPQSLFVKRTVREDLYEVFRGRKIPKSEQDEAVARVVSLCRLAAFLDRHPYDISGGEQQRSALAKVLLTSPDILLLDEPTKGFDAEFKESFAQILKGLLVQGITILMVSHDLPFCAEHAHICGMFFDGHVVTAGSPGEFFSGNSFYTTPANRMARRFIPKAVTVGDIVSCCGGAIASAQALPEILALPQIKVNSVNYKPKALPLWRKALAALSLSLAMLVFFYATSITDLSSLIGGSGISDAGFVQLKLYIWLVAALGIFIMSIGRRSEPAMMLQTPVEQRRLGKRTALAAIIIVLFIPITIFAGVFYLDGKHYNLVALMVLFECMVPFFVVFEGRKPKARELVVVAVLCAMGVAGRCAFFMLPQFKPVMALVIISGVAFGGEAGFLVGAITMLVSNVVFSQGPWMPWQMFSMGIIGFLAGVLFRKGWLRRSRGALATYGAFAAVIIYGGIMNPAAAVMYNSGNLNRHLLMAYYVSGFPMDLVHAAATVIFILLAAEPMLEKLDRIKSKYGFYESVT